jgi:hypothetical protein
MTPRKQDDRRFRILRGQDNHSLGDARPRGNPLQLLIGVSMVLRGFPLWLATAHTAGAALLVLAALALVRYLSAR